MDEFRMFRNTALLVAGLACLLLVGCSARPQRLLFVVPLELPDGRSSAGEMSRLEGWLAESAGGFTRVNNVEGGWISPDGTMVREGNVLYMLSLPRHSPPGFERELESRILADFDQQEAWIQKW